MEGTRWGRVLRECIGNIHREAKITFCRVPEPEKWVFVVGCYNSGTTLLRKILGSHPQINALSAEGQYLTDQLPSDHEIGLSRMWVKREDIYRLTEMDEGPDVTRIKKEWGMRLEGSGSLILDQTPANAARTRWIQKNFNNSYFIGMIRDGYAVSEGISRKANPVHSKNGWSLKDAAYQWSRSNEILLEDSDRLDNFAWCKYEDLTENPSVEIKRLTSFLGITDIDQSALKRSWSVHERDTGIRNMNGESFGRLTGEQVGIITPVIECMMGKFGYEIHLYD